MRSLPTSTRHCLARAGIKSWSCGAETSSFLGNPMEVLPGPLTVVYEESVRHSGAPTRIALSRDGEDIYDCILLDHIPANPASSPTYMQDATYVPYRVTIMIPDVQCERCSLQLVNPMTDKISTAAPFNGKCQYREGSPSDSPDYCFSVYHSCTLPLRIKGRVPRSQLGICSQPDAWPWSGLPYGVYSKGEQASWTSDGWLASVPAEFTQPAGACAGLPYDTSQAVMPRPSDRPTVVPSFGPTVAATAAPSTAAPTDTATAAPSTAAPTVAATAAPLTAALTPGPTPMPTISPTIPPTFAPTALPTVVPTAVPSPDDTRFPTWIPGMYATPTESPTPLPSTDPSSQPPTWMPGTFATPTRSPMPSNPVLALTVSPATPRPAVNADGPVARAALAVSASTASPDIRIGTAVTVEPKAPDAAESTPRPAKLSAISSASPSKHNLQQPAVVLASMMVLVAFRDAFSY